MQILDSINSAFFMKVLKLCTSWWTESYPLPYLRVNSANCTDLGLVPNILKRLDSRSWILSMTISIYSVSANDLAADTAIPSTSKVLRTMARRRAMVGEILGTSDQSYGKICGGERMTRGKSQWMRRWRQRKDA
jgi:hypothetical protein